MPTYATIRFIDEVIETDIVNKNGIIKTSYKVAIPINAIRRMHLSEAAKYVRSGFAVWETN